MNSIHQHPNTTFKAAFPYGAATVAASLGATAMTIAATSTAVKVIAIFAAVISIFTFFSVILCAIKNSGNPQQFQKEIHQSMITATGSAIISVTNQIVTAALNSLIDRLFYGENSNRFHILVR
jgi:hypothetical protein